MTEISTLDDLADLVADAYAAPDLEVALVSQRKASEAQDPVRILNLRGDAEQFFRDVISRVVVAGRAEWVLRALDSVYKPEPHEVEWALSADVPAIALAVDRYSNLGPFPQFNPGEEAFKRRLRYWVCVLTGHDGEKAYFFRRFSRSAELSRKAGAAMVSRQGAFHRVEEAIFIFDEAIDCFVFGEYLYVLRKFDYRGVFDQFEQLRARAQAAAVELGNRIPITNLDEFVAACSAQASMADRIIAVQNSDYFATLTMENLLQVIDEFDLELQIDDVDGEQALTFRSDAAHRWEILKLVGDDYLKSSMTDHKYETNSKIEL